MVLLGGVIEVKWHGFLRRRVQRVIENDGRIAAINYIRRSKGHKKWSVRRALDYVKNVDPRDQDGDA